jgi:3-oxoacyl-[acyl-carrier protein] reductase
MDLKLKGKVAFVTGGSHGLGKAICLSLAAEGVHICVNYRRNPEKVEQFLKEITDNHGVEAVGIQGDVAIENEVLAMFKQIEAKFPQLDILVNNAAVCPTCQVKDMEEQEWSHTLAVNMTGTFLTSREMVKRLLDKGCTGRIVNITSQAAFRGSTTGHAPYDASKGGIVSFTIALAREVAEHGITVNAVAPGMMFTEMTEGVLTANEEKYLNRIPLRRIGTTEEVADVVTFLASERASYMTGATVDVTGGMLMR